MSKMKESMEYNFLAVKQIGRSSTLQGGEYEVPWVRIYGHRSQWRLNTEHISGSVARGGGGGGARWSNMG